MLKRKTNKININNKGLHKSCADKIYMIHQKLVLKENEELLKQIKSMDNKIKMLEKEIKILKDNEYELEKLFYKAGINSYDDIYHFIVDLYDFKTNHICKDQSDDGENKKDKITGTEGSQFKVNKEIIDSHLIDSNNIYFENSSQNVILNVKDNIKDNEENKSFQFKSDNKDITLKDKSLNQNKSSQNVISENIIFSNKSDNNKKNNKKINEMCPIYICKENDEDWKKYIVNKTNSSLIYNNELQNILTKDNIDINNAADFILNLKKMQNTDSNRNKIKLKKKIKKI